MDDSGFREGVRSLPKVELHAHLGGSARRATVEKLLLAQGREDAKERAAGMVMPKDELGIPVDPVPFEPFQIIWEAHQGEREHIQRIVREYLEDCVSDGIAYVELRTGGDDKQKLEAILDAFDEANHSVDCIARLIVSLKRDAKDMKGNLLAIQHAVELRERGIVGIDFCGPPGKAADAPQGSLRSEDYVWEHLFTDQFAAAVQIAQDAGLSFVPHFAEFPSEPDHQKILAAQPARLGHAICMSDETWLRVKEAGIPIECCLVSNLNTMRRHNVLPEGTGHPAARHPFVRWFHDEHPFVLCCDNIGLHETSLSEHYMLAAIVVSSSPEEQRANAWKMAWTAVQHILGGEDVKKTIRERLISHPWSCKSTLSAGACDRSQDGENVAQERKAEAM